jgi:thiol-disulfide isomerase/thioredoxin
MTLRSLAASASIIALCLIGAAGPAISGEVAPLQIAAVQGTAPNFVGINNWFNSAPLNIADLRGKVVLVDFWTYGCVNCVNTLPHVTELYAKYKDRGLVVVGVHTPEFPFERSASNVQTALKRHGITYPVAQDNDSQTWDAYRNQYWPAQYIVDQSGKIVYQHDGEGCVQGNSIQRELALTGVMFLLQLVCSHPLTGETWGDAGVLSPYISRCRNNMLAASTVIKPRSNDDGWCRCSRAGMPWYWPGRSSHSRCRSTSCFRRSRLGLQVTSRYSKRSGCRPGAKSSSTCSTIG